MGIVKRVSSAISNFFTGMEREEPVIAGYSLGNIILNYNLNFEIFYEFYKKNPYLRSVINKLKGEVGKHGYIIKVGETEKNNKPFEDVIKYGGYTIKGFFERIQRDFEITGNAYVYIMRDDKKVVGFKVLSPQYIHPIGDKFGNLLGFYQNLQGIQVYLPDEILHLKDDCDNENEYIGISKIEALFKLLDTDEEARDSNLAFFKNNQTPSSIIVMEGLTATKQDEPKTKEKLNEIKNLFNGGKFKGGKNHHRGAFFGGKKLEVIKVQDKIDDIQFLEMTKFHLSVVCSMYEVPKDTIGFTQDTKYDNTDQQHFDFYETISKKEKILAEFMTQLISFIPEYNGAKFEFFEDHILILKMKGKLAQELSGGPIITPDEAREFIQYKPINTDETKKLRSGKINSDSQNVGQGNK